jgi:hypothetical protein
MDFALPILCEHPQDRDVDEERQKGEPDHRGAERVTSEPKTANDVSDDAGAQEHERCTGPAGRGLLESHTARHRHEPECVRSRVSEHVQCIRHQTA